MTLPQTPGPIGIFDSGYGGLTILQGIRQQLPQYDYVYLGDNARAPYGSRSFDVVYQFTRQAVVKLFEMGLHEEDRYQRFYELSLSHRAHSGSRWKARRFCSGGRQRKGKLL